jgi:hypothetical protein
LPVPPTFTALSNATNDVNRLPLAQCGEYWLREPVERGTWSNPLGQYSH